MEMLPINLIRRDIPRAKELWQSLGGDPSEIEAVLLKDDQRLTAENELARLQLHQERLQATIEASETTLVYDRPPQKPEEELLAIDNQIMSQQLNIEQENNEIIIK